MSNEREKISDLIIVQFIDPLMIFEIQRQAAARLRLTVGQIADRAIAMYLAEWLKQYPVEQLPLMLNLHPRTLDRKIKLLV